MAGPKPKPQIKMVEKKMAKATAPQKPMKTKIIKAPASRRRGC